VLTLIGGAIGLATLSPATGQSPSGTALGLGAAIWLVISSLISLFVAGYVAGLLGGTFNGWRQGLATWATLTTLTLLLLATAAGELVGAASGVGAFAVSNSDKMSRTQLPPTVQQQVDQIAGQARQTMDQTAAQAQAMTPEQRQAQARDLGQRAAKGGARRNWRCRDSDPWRRGSGDRWQSWPEITICGYADRRRRADGGS